MVKLPQVLGEDGKVRIRMSHDRPRLGVVMEGHVDVSVGFVFCNLSSTVSELRSEIAKQLPYLHASLTSREYRYLDQNSWPISTDQESELCVLEIASSHSVKIRCNHNLFSRGVSMIEDSQDKRYSVSDSLPVPALNDERPLSPIVEQPDGIRQASDYTRQVSNYTDTKTSMSDINDFEILLSYVHTEAGNYALLLKNALVDMGYSVFLDIHCIEGGKDWQDVLNLAITNCSLFVPLITTQYGKTLWTNREVKLADVLGKLILPVNFEQSWPPKCLAIQFATTQYITGNPTESSEMTPESFTSNDASEVAMKIVEQYKKEVPTSKVAADSEEIVISDPTLLSRQSTEIFDEPDVMPASTPSSAGLKVPLLPSVTRRRSAIRSYGSNLPETVPERYRKSLLGSREGKPLIVISCSPKQREFAEGLVVKLQSKECEVWCSCDVNERPDEQKSALFQIKVDEAGAVIFILSKDFSEDTFCEQQVYYCEQRKRIIPLVYEPIEMPTWMATLIGTSTFIDCKSQSYLTALLDRISAVLNPNKAENELQQLLRQKTEVATLCSELDKKLPPGNHVYVSGGTKFFSKNGEAICKEIGRQLAQEENMVIVTGGFYGVGETVGRSFFEERERLNQPHGVCHVIATRDELDKSTQTRQNPDKTFQEVPYGDTLFFGNSVRQREMLTPRVIDLCILVEGGPGAAFEAQQFVWNGNQVIPIRVTGGAAGGMFNVPAVIMIRPPNVAESDWSVLGDESASPSEIAAAVVRIAKTLKDLETGFRSRANTDAVNAGKMEALREAGLAKLKRVNAKLMKRSDTMPKVVRTLSSSTSEDNTTTATLKGVRRALSEHGSREK